MEELEVPLLERSVDMSTVTDSAVVASSGGGGPATPDTLRTWQQEDRCLEKIRELEDGVTTEDPDNSKILS